MPASAKVLAVSAEVAPHDFNFDMIIFLLMSGIGGKKAIVSFSYSNPYLPL